MTIVHPSETAAVLRRHGIRLAPSLGQNFLVDANVLDRIIATAAIVPNDVILEVGPGIGTLTEKLLQSAKRVIAIELDHRFVRILQEDTLIDNPGLFVIQNDALKVDLRPSSFDLPPTLVVSNLPYNIAGPLIIKLLIELTSAQRFILMVQREIADRLLAKPGTKSYGALTVKVAYFAQVRQVAQISRQAFMPVPRVDSTVVELKRVKTREKPGFREILFRVIEASFAQRRKQIKNALRNIDGRELDEVKIIEALDVAGIEPKKRGESLGLDDFLVLATAINAVMTRET